MSSAVETSRAIIARHSKSFSLASRLLPLEVRDRVVVVYAWCRRADDAVDQVLPELAPEAVTRLARELDVVFGSLSQPSAAAMDESSGAVLGDDILKAFREVVRETGMPRHYPAELVEGMAMDASDESYPTLARLLEYCYRVAGTVGLMMSHVMGVAEVSALRNAVHLGMAMQLTNISRDVREDWDRGRLYIPDEVLSDCGAGDLRGELGRPLPLSARGPMARGIERLLSLADRLYESGDQGLGALEPRCAWAVSAASKVYSEIGSKLREGGYDVFAPRAHVSKARKIGLVAEAALHVAPLANPRGRFRSLGSLASLPTIEFMRDGVIDGLLS